MTCHFQHLYIFSLCTVCKIYITSKSDFVTSRFLHYIFTSQKQAPKPLINKISHNVFFYSIDKLLQNTEYYYRCLSHFEIARLTEFLNLLRYLLVIYNCFLVANIYSIDSEIGLMKDLNFHIRKQDWKFSPKLSENLSKFSDFDMVEPTYVCFG